VVVEIGPEHIVHIVTDNGSNYKKACRQLKEVYEHIIWTPCLAHTVNLMLKDIGKRPEHQVMITNCKRISAWLHNHGQLNTMMREAIGGELVKWNATRFGTNYMFLESLHRKRDKFMQWMTSPAFFDSKWAKTAEGRFAQVRLSSIEWWEGMDYIIKTVEPIYRMLRFADQDKKLNMGDVVMAYQQMKTELESYFGSNVHTWNEYKEILDNRICDVYWACMLVQVRLYESSILNLYHPHALFLNI
jgi:hypothetical protein